MTKKRFRISIIYTVTTEKIFEQILKLTFIMNTAVKRVKFDLIQASTKMADNLLMISKLKLMSRKTSFRFVRSNSVREALSRHPQALGQLTFALAIKKSIWLAPLGSALPPRSLFPRRARDARNHPRFSSFLLLVGEKNSARDGKASRRNGAEAVAPAHTWRRAKRARARAKSDAAIAE